MLVHRIPVVSSHVKSIIPNKAVCHLFGCTQASCCFEKADFMTTLNTYWALTNGATWRRGATALIIPITLIPRLLNLLVKIHGLPGCALKIITSPCFLHNYIYGHCSQVFQHHRMQLPSSRARQPATRPTPFPSKPLVFIVCLLALFLSLVKRAPLPQLFT